MQNDTYLSIEHDSVILEQALDELAASDIQQEGQNIMLRVAGNPILHSAAISGFNKGISNFQQACIHIVLGRGYMLMDEAFTIGFTLGCSNKAISKETRLYRYAQTSLYPLIPEFGEAELAVMRNAVKLGYISNCLPLADFDFNVCIQEPVSKVRRIVGIDSALLRASYAVEKRRYPVFAASRRLLPNEPKPLVY